jgi:hypothetical protein
VSSHKLGQRPVDDVKDARQLSQDPTFRLMGSEKSWGRGVALSSRLQSFEAEVLAQEERMANKAAAS